MPQTTPERAARWENDGKAWGFLKSRGWTEARNGFLVPPPLWATRTQDNKNAEWDAALYLHEERDYWISTYEDEYPRIIGVAVKLANGVVLGAMSPARHYQIVNAVEEHIPLTEQGFLASNGQYVSREDALALVRHNKQLSRPLIGSVLTSEDLW